MRFLYPDPVLDVTEMFDLKLLRDELARQQPATQDSSVDAGSLRRWLNLVNKLIKHHEQSQKIP